MRSEAQKRTAATVGATKIAPLVDSKSLLSKPLLTHSSTRPMGSPYIQLSLDSSSQVFTLDRKLVPSSLYRVKLLVLRILQSVAAAHAVLPALILAAMRDELCKAS
jgi:hypothetical protein